jgi:UDP-N-acetylmuramoyl-L-alanyl-D-glutamate--2,6-diaminopimelate ligase
MKVGLDTLFNELTDFNIRKINSIDDTKLQITNLQLDSRAVEPGALFFAFSGNRLDGRSFIEDAIQKGAVAVIGEKSASLSESAKNFDIAVYEATNLKVLLSIIAKRFYGDLSQKIISVGITGTNGKTTVSWIVAELLQHLVGETVHIGTLGYRSVGEKLKSLEKEAINTSPDVLSFYSFLYQADALNAKAMVCEVSSHALAQNRMLGINWDVAVFTNLTRDHLDYHQTFENYGEAKLKLFTECLLDSKKKNRVAVLNLADEFSSKINLAIAQVEIVVYTYSSKAETANVRLINSKLSLDGTMLVVDVCGEIVEVGTKLIGEYNVENTLASIAVMCALGFSAKDIADALTEVPRVPGRLEFAGDGEVGAYIDYAHTPDGLVSVLKSLRPLVKGRLIAVFGCGGDRDRGKRPLMGEAVAKLADYAVVTSDNPRSEEASSIIKEIVPGLERAKSGCKFQVVVNREDAIFTAVRLANPGDAILIAGKGHESYQEINGVKHHFSDVEVCKHAFREIRRT